MKNIWQQIEKLLGIYRWHPKISLRYLPVVQQLRQLSIDHDVLEVGSNGLGIAPYLKKRVVGVDISFSPPFHRLLIPIKADAAMLPFADESFAAVISLDMLEHIPPANRKRVIAEMMRVGRTMVCVGVPTGGLSHEQDEMLRKEFKHTHGKEFLYLEEQVEYGLPINEEIMDYMHAAAISLGKKITIHTQGNINMQLRKWLMKGWMSDNLVINVFYRKVLLLGIPFMLRMNQEPTYRQLYFVTIRHD